MARKVPRGMSRRRFVTLLASALPLSATATATATATILAGGQRISPIRWNGIAMGAQARMTLLHEDKPLALAAMGAAIAELNRLENIFSLYEPNSEVSRLNRDGHLKEPSLDLVRLLSEARAISKTTAGAFDVTVQPLFEAYARQGGTAPSPMDLAGARRLVDQRGVMIASDRISFQRQGMAITLNGIAQGYITDRVSELLRRRGFADTLVDLGEIRSNGAGPQGQGWPIAIAAAKLRLANRALATSSAAGHRFDRQGTLHHLILPSDGLPSMKFDSLSVLAPTATLADGLSTGLSLIEPHTLASIVSELPGINVLATTAAGSLIQI
ncbi:MAG: FAD:protein FMN transferase [Rhodospirillaceae bacterium]|jgi:FAD:protein FMN transferase|nr:FAD:protein FMN transferase [Rhodospirillaceae bacterium]MBT5894384.1 FAD:protein FMN transferase [Rhodospirillaceae bacterium]MBT6429650.1 FAD:protein FMN transferase [Rhodospirillaceae bacterium]